MNNEIKEILYVLKHIVIGRASRLTCREADKLLDYITNLQQKYDKALEYLSSFNFACENDEFFDEHCEWCDENCSVDEEQYKKCWNKFIEWKLGDRKDG